MANVYNEEFKKQLVKEYIQGKSYPILAKEQYGIAKSTLSGWVKKYSEECQLLQPHTASSPIFSPKEIQELHERIAELEKENLFLKKAATFFAKEVDQWCIALQTNIKKFSGYVGCLESSSFRPMLILTT